MAAEDRLARRNRAHRARVPRANGAHGMKVLVTGGAGYIGSHTCLELVARGHQVVIADNFSNSSPRVVPRLEELSGVAITAHKLDVRDREALAVLFKLEKPEAV